MGFESRICKRIDVDEVSIREHKDTLNHEFGYLAIEAPRFTPVPKFVRLEVTPVEKLKSTKVPVFSNVFESCNLQEVRPAAFARNEKVLNEDAAIVTF